jgi:hypothetical protein
VAGGLLLGIRLRFHKYAPKQIAIGLAFHQQAADELGGNHLSRAGEEGLGQAGGARHLPIMVITHRSAQHLNTTIQG